VLAENYPQQLSPELLDLYQEGMSARLHISLTARFDETCTLDVVSGIGANAEIGEDVVVKAGVFLGNNVNVVGRTILEKGVKITDGFSINPGAYFAEGARVAPRKTKATRHSYMRIALDSVIIGPNVVLPTEVQLGKKAVIPTTDSIAEIGRYGTSRRMVTAYGSAKEPLYSVGCQYGIGIARFKDRVAKNTGTEPKSAADYAKHMPEIEALGITVQAAYEREANLIDELRAQRKEAFAQARLNRL